MQDDCRTAKFMCWYLRISSGICGFSMYGQEPSLEESSLEESSLQKSSPENSRPQKSTRRSGASKCRVSKIRVPKNRVFKNRVSKNRVSKNRVLENRVPKNRPIPVTGAREGCLLRLCRDAVAPHRHFSIHTDTHMHIKHISDSEYIGRTS